MCEGRSFSRYHLHYPEKTSVIPVYLLSLNAGYVKTYAAASVSVLIALPEIIAFSLPAPKLPSAVLHLKMPFSLRFSCVCAFLSVSVDLHTPLIQRLYHVPTIMKFSFFVKTEACISGDFTYFPVCRPSSHFRILFYAFQRLYHVNLFQFKIHYPVYEQ